MAKAALEAMNGFNLYGDKGANWSVVYVDVVCKKTASFSSFIGSVFFRMHIIGIERHSIHFYHENLHPK